MSADVVSGSALVRTSFQNVAVENDRIRYKIFNESDW